MKSLVVYYSRTGNTKKVGQAIAKSLKADTEEIIDTKDRSGVLGYLKSGRDAMRKKAAVMKPAKKDPSKYDLVILGTPIWGWALCPGTRAYLEKYGKKLKKTAFFCTEGGSGGPKAFKDMEQLSKKPLATLEVLEREVKANSFDAKVKEFVKKLK